MEWVEVTGKTIAQAEELALDRLGVDRSEAEFSVISEPKSALLGLRKTEARVRARVRPSQHTKKPQRRRQPNRRANDGNKKTGSGGADRRRSQANAKSGGDRRGGKKPAAANKPKEGKARSGTARVSPKEEKVEQNVQEGMSLDEQERIVTDFLQGLLSAFEMDVDVAAVRVDPDTLEMRIQDGEQVGLLIGPKGNTLRSLEELTRTLVQCKSDGRSQGRIRLDVADYRVRRKAALESFTRKMAEQVRNTGQECPLEPMSAADRKVVHDVATDLDGVTTMSEGQEPRRWVVIVPE